MAQIKKFFFANILFLSVTLLAAENPVQDLFFEITRQTVCGASAFPVASAYTSFSAVPAQFFLRSVWQANKTAVPGTISSRYLIERVYPEKIGVIDATFSSDDVFCVTVTGRGVVQTDWVDAVLLALQFEDGMLPEPADEAISYDVAERMLAELDNRDDAGMVEGQASDAESPAELTFTDSAGRLRRFSYGAEYFSVRERDGVKIVTDSADNLVVRRSFDGEQRLIKQERFSLGATAHELKLLSCREYAYYDEHKLPYQMTETVTAGNKHNVTTYDDNGLAVMWETGHYEYTDPNDKKHKNDPPKLVQDKKNVWAYDDERRLIAEETTTYLYAKTTTGKEKIEANTIRKLYAYDGLGKQPDVSYFENGALRMHTVYASENVYNETLYFDGGFTVQTRYEGGVKTQEIILLDGTEVRRRTFEN